jgi:hypothetical protein
MDFAPELVNDLTIIQPFRRRKHDPGMVVEACPSVSATEQFFPKLPALAQITQLLPLASLSS